MEYILIGIAIAIGLYIAPLVIGLGVLVIGGIFSILGSIFGGRR